MFFIKDQKYYRKFKTAIKPLYDLQLQSFKRKLISQGKNPIYANIEVNNRASKYFLS